MLEITQTKASKTVIYSFSNQINISTWDNDVSNMMYDEDIVFVCIVVLQSFKKKDWILFPLRQDMI